MAVITVIVLSLIELILLYGLVKTFNFVILLLFAVVGVFVWKEIKVIRSSDEEDGGDEDEEDED
ncbi:hypothetical protein BM613_12685 [Sulfoacidibacillus thermotolerans]|uniref:Uncharacterized protein n=2 Tax=Sulfoacidibacillus thermotolerans TaxID=1765684 RepID=A0A2U3D5Q7_SULT2|nr:hypothetical protein BM613_12685 [Sulfoacidibacillus thermotolerans]